VLRNGPESVGSSFHGSLLSLLFHFDVFLSDFHFRSRQLLGGHLIVDGLDDIFQDFLFGHGSIDSQASRMEDPISKLGASLLNRSFPGSLLLLFRLDVFLSNFHSTSRQFLGGYHIVDGLDAITQELLFRYGSVDRFRSLTNGRFNLKAGAPPGRYWPTPDSSA
jgi:hypothetical protein